MPDPLETFLDTFGELMRRGHYESAERFFDTWLRENRPRTHDTELRWTAATPLDECIPTLHPDLVTRLDRLGLHTLGELHQAPAKDWGGQRVKFGAKDQLQMKHALRKAGLHWSEEGLPVIQR